MGGVGSETSALYIHKELRLLQFQYKHIIYLHTQNKKQKTVFACNIEIWWRYRVDDDRVPCAAFENRPFDVCNAEMLCFFLLNGGCCLPHTHQTLNPEAVLVFLIFCCSCSANIYTQSFEIVKMRKKTYLFSFIGFDCLSKWKKNKLNEKSTSIFNLGRARRCICMCMQCTACTIYYSHECMWLCVHYFGARCYCVVSCVCLCVCFVCVRRRRWCSVVEKWVNCMLDST